MSFRTAGMNRSLARPLCMSNKLIKAAVAASHDVSVAVAARPTIAPVATAAIQSKGANSATGRRAVSRNTTVAVRKSADVLTAASVTLEQLSIPVDQDLLGGLLFGGVVGAFDEFAVVKSGAGTDQGDQVGRVHGAPT
jgi:hypothetical protein